MGKRIANSHMRGRDRERAQIRGKKNEIDIASVLSTRSEFVIHSSTTN